MTRSRLIDLIGLTGLGLIALGTAILSPAWSLIVTGSLLLTAAIGAALKHPVDDEAPHADAPAES